MSYMPSYSYPQQRAPYPVQPPPTYPHQQRYPVPYPSHQQYSRPPQPAPQPTQSPVRPPIQPRQPAPKPPVKQPSQFPQLDKLTKEELQDLLDNENKVIDIVTDLDVVKADKLTSEMFLAENRSLAEYNLSREPRLTEGRQTLARAYAKNQQLRETFEQNMANLSILSSKHSLDSVLELLQASASQAEDDAEEIAERFLDGKTEVDDFVEEFRAKRLVYNLKKTKSEQLEKLVRTPQHVASYNTPPQGATPQIAPPQGSPYQHPYSLNQAYQPQMSGGYHNTQYMPRLAMPTLGSYPR
ncbi:vacuolar protein sorting-associated protein 37B-like [Antedon mediterranea]|uniref:vacuolar protein sorting-associated protein 37B-like n=1 Tax=Antedon mediterranea TaxID=105859 RepID=UPI003AF4DD65